MKVHVINLSERLWRQAEQRVSETPVYDLSHRKEAANEVGCLGEIVAEKWFETNRIAIQDERVTTHDYRLADGKTLDVKTKDRTVKPLGRYECSVPLYNHEHQHPDYYLFLSLWRNSEFDANDIRRFRTAYVLGASDQELLKAKGVTWRKGDIDPDNGTQFWTDCINLKIVDLFSLDRVIKDWRHG